MKYSTGRVGRVMVIKVEHGDDLLQELKNVMVCEKIDAAIMLMIGALQKGSMVVGPEDSRIPPSPVWRDFDQVREIVGVATVFTHNGQPEIHLHASAGRGQEVLTGCLRQGTRVHLVMEVILFELLGTGAVRGLDPLTGLNLLGFQE